MAGQSGAIRAGRAVVELFSDNSQLTRGLKSASKSLQDWGSQTAKAGLAIAGIAAAASAPLLAVGKVFATFTEGAKTVQEIQQRAADLGTQLSGKDAAAVLELRSTWDALGKMLQAVGVQIGTSLAPILTSIGKTINATGRTLVEWIKNNRGLIVSVAAVIASIGAAGIAIAGLGVTMTAIGMGLSAAATVVTTFGSAIGLLMTPIGLVSAGLAAWLVTSTDVVTQLKTLFRGLYDTASKVVTGIADALAAGDIQLAAEVLWTGLQAEWTAGVAALNETWQGWKNFFLNTFTAAGASIVKVWLQVQAALGKAFDMTITSMTTAFQRFANSVGRSMLGIAKSMGYFDKLPKFAYTGAMLALSIDPATANNKARDKRLAKIDSDLTASIGAIDADTQATADRRAGSSAASVAASRAAANDAAKRFADALGKASAARAGVAADLTSGRAAAGELKTTSAGVTNSFALRTLAGQDPMTRTARSTEKLVELTRDVRRGIISIEELATVQ